MPIYTVIEMSQSSWLVAGMLPGIERQPRKKLDPSPERLLGLLLRWQGEVVRAGRTITRIALAFEAGRDRRKRESYRSAFDDFEPSKIAGYGERKLAELLDNPGIIRNRLKIEGAVVNAKAFIEVQRHFGIRHLYLAVRQSHTCAKCKGGHGRHSSSSKESDAMSKDLRKRGFKFVGTTIC